jgi:hypothetical protein
MKFELVVEIQRFPVLDISLKATPTHCWCTYKEKINNWFKCKRLPWIRFVIEQEHRYEDKYDGIGKPKKHVYRCMVQWILIPPK